MTSALRERPRNRREGGKVQKPIGSATERKPKAVERKAKGDERVDESDWAEQQKREEQKQRGGGSKPRSEETKAE